MVLFSPSMDREETADCQGEDQQLVKERHWLRRDACQRAEASQGAAAGRGAAAQPAQPAGQGQPAGEQQRYFELVLYTLLSILEVPFEVNKKM